MLELHARIQIRSSVFQKKKPTAQLTWPPGSSGRLQAHSADLLRELAQVLFQEEVGKLMIQFRLSRVVSASFFVVMGALEGQFT